MRRKLKDIYESDKQIRTGEKLLHCTGVVGGRNNDGGSPLILDVRLFESGEELTDHVWLGNLFDGYDKDDRYKFLRAYKKNKLKGKIVEFTARVLPYNNSKVEFGLRLTKESELYIYE